MRINSISRVLNYGFQFSEVTKQDWSTVRSDLCIVFIFYNTWSILYFPRFNHFAHQLKDRKVVAHSLVARKNEIVLILYHCDVPKDSQLKLTHESFHLECERSVAPSCVTHWLAARCWKCMSCDQSSLSSHFDFPYILLWHAQQSLLCHCTVLRSRDEQSRDNIISRPHQKHIQSHNSKTWQVHLYQTKYNFWYYKLLWWN